MRSRIFRPTQGLSEDVLQAGHDCTAPIITDSVLGIISANINIVGTDFHGIIYIPVHADGVALGFTLIRQIRCSD